MKNILYSIIVPVYNGEKTIKELTERLLIDLNHTNFEIIFIYDCGPDNSWQVIKSIVEKYPDIVNGIHLSRNYGQHNAIICGIKESKGDFIITMDEDLQHRPEDICRIKAAAISHPDTLILGAREFNGRVPLRSRLGNSLTRRLYNVLFQQKLNDTQTGLRGIPVSTLDSLLRLTGARYSYELEMLIVLNQLQIPVMEVPISTVYENNNSSSHFHPVRDSVQIYRTLFSWWWKTRKV